MNNVQEKNGTCRITISKPNLVKSDKNPFLRAMCDVSAGPLKVLGFKILIRKDGALFVGFPSRKNPSRKSGYENVIEITNVKLREKFQGAVLDAYKQGREVSAVLNLSEESNGQG